MANYSGQSYYVRETNLLYRVYAWMCLALGITAVTAYYVSQSPAFINAIFGNPIITVVLMVAQLGLVLLLSLLINRISFAAAAGLFLVYAVSLGLTLSAIFLVYTYSSIFSTFLVASGMFGAMALYGYFTKADLSAMGSFLFMALIGLILGGLVNMFFKSESFNYVLSAIGVIVFTLLTAYDVQKIKQMASGLYQDSDSMAKASILGALTLYLDFVNLFLFLLQIMGRRRE